MLPPAQVPGGVPSSNAAHRPTQPRLLPALPQPDALLTGFERDIHKLIDIFAEGVLLGASCTFAAFKQLWRERSMSFIHQAYPGVEHCGAYTQLLYATALDRLDTHSPTAAPGTPLGPPLPPPLPELLPVLPPSGALPATSEQRQEQGQLMAGLEGSGVAGAADSLLRGVEPLTSAGALMAVPAEHLPLMPRQPGLAPLEGAAVAAAAAAAGQAGAALAAAASAAAVAAPEQAGAMAVAAGAGLSLHAAPGEDQEHDPAGDLMQDMLDLLAEDGTLPLDATAAAELEHNALFDVLQELAGDAAGGYLPGVAHGTGASLASPAFSGLPSPPSARLGGINASPPYGTLPLSPANGGLSGLLGGQPSPLHLGQAQGASLLRSPLASGAAASALASPAGQPPFTTPPRRRGAPRLRGAAGGAATSVGPGTAGGVAAAGSGGQPGELEAFLLSLQSPANTPLVGNTPLQQPTALQPGVHRDLEPLALPPAAITATISGGVAAQPQLQPQLNPQLPAAQQQLAHLQGAAAPVPGPCFADGLQQPGGAAPLLPGMEPLTMQPVGVPYQPDQRQQQQQQQPPQDQQPALPPPPAPEPPSPIPTPVKAGVLFTLLCLYETQHAPAKVRIYLPLQLAQLLPGVARELAKAGASDALAALAQLRRRQLLVVGALRRPHGAPYSEAGRRALAAAAEAARRAAAPLLPSKHPCSVDPELQRDVVFHVKGALRGLTNFRSLQALCSSYAEARGAIFAPLSAAQQSARSAEEEERQKRMGKVRPRPVLAPPMRDHPLLPRRMLVQEEPAWGDEQEYLDAPEPPRKRKRRGKRGQLGEEEEEPAPEPPPPRQQQELPAPLPQAAPAPPGLFHEGLGELLHQYASHQSLRMLQAFRKRLKPPKSRKRRQQAEQLQAEQQQQSERQGQQPPSQPDEGQQRRRRQRKTLAPKPPEQPHMLEEEAGPPPGAPAAPSRRAQERRRREERLAAAREGTQDLVAEVLLRDAPLAAALQRVRGEQPAAASAAAVRGLQHMGDLRQSGLLNEQALGELRAAAAGMRGAARTALAAQAAAAQEQVLVAEQWFAAQDVLLRYERQQQRRQRRLAAMHIGDMPSPLGWQGSGSAAPAQPPSRPLSRAPSSAAEAAAAAPFAAADAGDPVPAAAMHTGEHEEHDQELAALLDEHLFDSGGDVAEAAAEADGAAAVEADGAAAVEAAASKPQTAAGTGAAAEAPLPAAKRGQSRPPKASGCRGGTRAGRGRGRRGPAAAADSAAEVEGAGSASEISASAAPAAPRGGKRARSKASPSPAAALPVSPPRLAAAEPNAVEQQEEGQQEEEQPKKKARQPARTAPKRRRTPAKGGAGAEAGATEGGKAAASTGRNGRPPSVGAQHRSATKAASGGGSTAEKAATTRTRPPAAGAGASGAAALLADGSDEDLGGTEGGDDDLLRLEVLLQETEAMAANS